MLTSLLSLLVVALVLIVIWYIVGMFIGGKIQQIVGIILAVVFLIYALKLFGLVTV